jgi:glycosyltransferase involved in cell wall biosynthesis
MKIVYLHQYFNTPASGGGTRSYEFARRLAAAGHEVHVVTSRKQRDGDRGWRTEQIAGVTVHSVQISYSNRLSYPARIRAFGAFAIRAARRTRRLRGDVIFATSTPLTIILPAVFARFFRRTPIIFEVRDVWPEVPIALGALRNPVMTRAAFSLQRLAYGTAAEIVALSPSMRDAVVARGVPADRVTVIPNASDLALFQNPSDTELQSWRDQHPELVGKRFVLYAGTLGFANDAGYLVDLATALRDRESDVAVVIVGDGSEADLIRERAQAARVLDDSLFMHPPASKHQVAAYLHYCSIAFSLFRRLEILEWNSPNKFFDALAAGKPVAINYRGWQWDLIERYGAGFVLDPLDFERAAAAVDTLVRDENLLRAMSDAAFNLALDEFDRDKLADKLHTVILRASSA